MTNTTSTTVTFSWIPPSEKGDGVLDHYYRYKIRTQGNLVYSDWVASTDNNGALIKNLKPYTKYELSLSARNKHGLGESSNVSFITQQAGTVLTYLIYLKDIVLTL